MEDRPGYLRSRVATATAPKQEREKADRQDERQGGGTTQEPDNETSHARG
jgi:hypothetical protein